LLGLFCISVGAGINFSTLFGNPLTIIGLTIALMAVKALVLYILAFIFRIRSRDKMLFTLSLAQAGEFGFVLTSFSLQQHVIPTELAESLLLIIALSMLLTPLLFIAHDAFAARMAASHDAPEHDSLDENEPIIIAGVGRFGQVVNRLVQSSGFQTTVLDHDLKMIELMRRFGFKGFFGDPTRPEMLHAAGIETATVLVVALDDTEAALKLVKHARKERPDLIIIARARDRIHTYQLYAAGADKIVRELFDSSLRAGRYVLEGMGLTEHEAHEQEITFFKMDRSAMAELARVWDPKIPVAENTAYVERSKELERDLEVALVRALDDTQANEA
jgi:CPA2 family monovalent cation:H+ antiporter-2